MTRVGSLFSGIGGLEMAVSSLLPDAQTAWQVEIDPFCRDLLKARFPGTAVHEDVRQVGRHNLEPIDMLVGGFPCQDISCAGQGKGIREDTRSGLFFQMWRIAMEMQPRFVLLENVPVISARGLDTVATAITESGWTLEWHCMAASDVGAHHRRNRWWGIAHREDPLHSGYWRIGQRRGGRRVLQGAIFGDPEPVDRFPSAGMASREGLFIRDSSAPSRSSYPTPTASDWKGPNRSGSGSCSANGLATVVDMWPTPSADQAGDGKLFLDKLKTKEGNNPEQGRRAYNSSTGLHTQITLNRAVKLWPTPTASQRPSEGAQRTMRACVASGMISRTDAAAMTRRDPWLSQGALPEVPGKIDPIEIPAGRLNPDWVEALMGYASGWTDPEQDPQDGMMDGRSWDDGTWEDGVPRLTARTEHRSNRLKALGNSVVPQCAAAAFTAVAERIRA